MNSKKILYIFLFLLFALILFFFFRRNENSSKTSSNKSTTQVKPLQTQSINREFSFPLNNGVEDVAEIKFEVTDVELTDEIIVQGQKATAIAGRDFLIINLKITNEYEKAIEMSTRDYIRLLVNDNQEEKLAPEIHNDPVEIQAISTKHTRVGFPINESWESLSLLVGQIKEEKEQIKLFDEEEK